MPRPYYSVTVLILFLYALLCIVRISAVIENLPSSEIAALHSLYTATDGEHWNWKLLNAGERWNFSGNPNPCVDQWQGITCNEPIVIGQNRHVVRLELNRYRLRGYLPPAILDLPNLNALELTDNRLEGPFPAFLGNLTLLNSLSLAVNGFTGTIPETLAQLTSLQALRIYGNNLIGTLPDFLSTLTQLQYLVVYLNGFTGTIPESYGTLSNLQFFEANTNHLDGSIPQSFGNLQNLIWLFLYGNSMTGSAVPDVLCSLTSLQQLALRDNTFTGTIPDCIGSWENITYLDISSNDVQGSIPGTIGRLSNLTVLWLNDNSLTGTIPEEIGNLIKLKELYMLNNALTGSIPASLGDITGLPNLYLQNNLLTGSIPQELGQMDLELIYLQENLLTGSIPSLDRLQGLREVFLQSNRLSHSLSGLFNHTTQRSLEIIQVSENQLTGSIPDEIFLLRKLTTFAAATNCITGTLSETICSARALSTLILDGLKCATGCRAPLLPAAHSYHVTHNTHGTIPACLFRMNKLSALHLSGNGLSGTLPGNISAHCPLVDLAVTHNALTGIIPAAIQARSWVNLDLSVNRLTGGLDPSFASNVTVSTVYLGNISYNATEVTYSLQNNRLSGNIPRGLVNFVNISVLGSNLFACKVDKSDLPQHDGDIDTYQCGSNAFNYPFYAFLAMTCAVAAALVCTMYVASLRKVLPSIDALRAHIAKWDVRHETELEQVQFVVVISNLLCQVGMWCTALILLLLVPWYASASFHYGTYTHMYAWVVSAAFLSGLTPTLVELFLFFLLNAFLAAFSRYMVVRVDSRPTRSSRPASIRSMDSASLLADQRAVPLQRRIAAYAAFAAVNLFVVVGMNVAFVTVVLTQSNGVLFIAQVLLSIFKLFWNTACTPRLIRLTSTYVSGSRHGVGFMTLQIVIALFNNIAVPCLVVAVTSPACFYLAFQPPSPIQSSFVYASTVRPGADLIERSFYRVTDYISFSPPFTYDFQCSSSLITYYAPAFIYLAIAAALATPAAEVVGVCLHQRATPGTMWYKVLDWSLPRILNLPQASAAAESRDAPLRTYFNAMSFIVSLSTYLGILLTFGVVFPPVAVAMCVTMVSVAWHTQLSLGRFLQHARENHGQVLVDHVEKECAGAVTLMKLRRSIFIIICFSCSFCALFLFDTLGNAVGVHHALWVLVVLPLFPVCIYAASRLQRHLVGTDLAAAQGSVDSARSGLGVGRGLAADKSVELLERGSVAGNTGVRSATKADQEDADCEAADNSNGDSEAVYNVLAAKALQ